MSEINEPYIIQITTPISSIISIGSERSFVCFVRIALNDCGRNANVVKEAATKPIIKVLFNSDIYNYSNCIFVSSVTSDYFQAVSQQLALTPTCEVDSGILIVDSLT